MFKRRSFFDILCGKSPTFIEYVEQGFFALLAILIFLGIGFVTFLEGLTLVGIIEVVVDFIVFEIILRVLGWIWDIFYPLIILGILFFIICVWKSMDDSFFVHYSFHEKVLGVIGALIATVIA